MLDWATVRGHRSGDNPARWKGHLSEALPAPGKVARVVNHPAVPYADIPKLMADLTTREGTGAKALRFLILAAARAGEVRDATWDEIDLDNALWVIPAERMKSRREHRVPLAPQAVQLLKGLYQEEGNPHLFIGRRTGAQMAQMALSEALRRAGRTETVHGLRSSFSDWAHESTSFSNHEIELSLAHTVGSGTEKAYRRGDMADKRRRLMEAWATFCTSPAAQGGKVVAIRDHSRETSGEVLQWVRSSF